MPHLLGLLQKILFCGFLILAKLFLFSCQALVLISLQHRNELIMQLGLNNSLRLQDMTQWSLFQFLTRLAFPFLVLIALTLW